MSEIQLTWRRYGLRDNPYFQNPLTTEDSTLLATFVGRKAEKAELKKVLQMGSDIRYLIIGEPGVGKTSLVNIMRMEASRNKYFTPTNEIEINREMTGNELIVITLSAIYQEMQKQSIDLDEHLMVQLQAFYELANIVETSSRDLTNITYLNRHKLLELFKEVVDKLVNPRFHGIIIHYDNLDNVDADALVTLISDVRDFLLTKRVIFLFVGDPLLTSVVNIKPRVSQIFLSPSLEVEPLSYEKVLELLEKRVSVLKSSDNTPVVCPHTDEAVKTLFDLHKGNLRSILNSLTNAVMELPSSNTPIQVTDTLLSNLLYRKVKEKYISKLTKVEQDILFKMLEHQSITPSELSKLTGKTPQNISSKYLKEFIRLGVVREPKKEGRNSIYEVIPEINWWRLGKKEAKKKPAIENEIQIKIDKVQGRLSDFFD